MKSRRKSNVEATRAALLKAARKHFAREGYSGAELGRIAAEAGLTTGALYHHFAGKKALFQAVAEAMEAEILAAAAAISESDPWRRVRAAFQALIDIGAAADVQRIIFVEAPQVIGPEAWRAIELRYAFGALRSVMVALQAAGVVKPYPVDFIARSLLALLREAAAEVARAKHDPQIRAQVVALVDGVLELLAARSNGDAATPPS